MIEHRSRTLRVVAALAIAAAIALVAGCSGTSSTGSSSTAPAPVKLTALKAYAIAKSTLSTTAPDGKLLVAQTVEPITTTSTPSWEFLVGSPKSGNVYAVIVRNGKGTWSQYSQADLSATEWTQVPADSAWKIDSDVALAKALEVYPNGKNAAYIPGFITYIPPAAQDGTVKTMTWIMNFDPASKGTASTSTVNVDLGTGKAELAK